MKTFVNVTFPTGHIFELPTVVVAADRINYYSMQDPDRTKEQHTSETMNLFQNEFEVVDWMKNNMNWSDVEKSARLVGFNAPDFGAAWDDAVLEFTSEQGKPDVMALGDRAITAPLEMLLGQAVSEGMNCSVVAFMRPGTQVVTSAVAAIIGRPDVVGGYIAVLQNFDNFMRSQAQKPAEH